MSHWKVRRNSNRDAEREDLNKILSQISDAIDTSHQAPTSTDEGFVDADFLDGRHGTYYLDLANHYGPTLTINNATSDTTLILSQQGTTDSAWTIKNNEATGRLTITDDSTGVRVPVKFGLSAADNAFRVGIVTDLIDTTLGIRSSHATQGIGYSAGAGGTVTQITSKSTDVTLDKSCGVITMHNAILNAGAAVTFTLTNSAIEATDFLVLKHHATGTLGNYEFSHRCAAGSATICVRNVTAGNLSEAVQVGFLVLKGASS